MYFPDFHFAFSKKSPNEKVPQNIAYFEEIKIQGLEIESQQ
jgi:hypothetical protein